MVSSGKANGQGSQRLGFLWCCVSVSGSANGYGSQLHGMERTEPELVRRGFQRNGKANGFGLDWWAWVLQGTLRLTGQAGFGLARHGGLRHGKFGKGCPGLGYVWRAIARPKGLVRCGTVSKGVFRCGAMWFGLANGLGSVRFALVSLGWDFRGKAKGCGICSACNGGVFRGCAWMG